MVKSKSPRISAAEWDVMRVVWSHNPVLACKVIDEVAAAHKWHAKTVRTLLARLVKKGALTFEKQGRAYRYRPLVKEADCIQAESDLFLQRVFGGAITPMLAHFVERRKISESEMREIKRLLR
jgi:BlaI family transcriptional regulator, penicillinase repressor